MDLISEKELLKQLSCSRQSLWRYKAQGLKYYKVRGKTFFKPSEIIQFVERYGSHFKKVTTNDNRTK